MTGLTPDYLPIALRAYSVPQIRQIPQSSFKRGKKYRSALPASEYAIIFDTETLTEASQSLRFGSYQVRKNDELIEVGLFYDSDGISESEYATLAAYAKRHDVQLIRRDQFVDEIFFKIGWQCRAAIIGFNLPFDISRIAIRHEPARNDMCGGFSFMLSEQKIYPHVRVKHLSKRAALIDFAATMRQPDSRGMRKRGQHIPIRRGQFVDVKTLASALLERSFTLAGLAQYLKVPDTKLEFDGFDGPIEDEMIAYAVRDTETTWQCYRELCRQLGELELPTLVPEKAYSAASIGKAYLRQMGVLPWMKCQPDFPLQMTADILSSYFGGRSEVRIRREIRQVILCDFLSMYPTVCTLMGLWRFVIAKGMMWRNATDETRDLLSHITIADLQSPDRWPELTTLVRVGADGDVLPVRADYGDKGASTIGLNCLSASQPLWFTLADCIASKLLTGKAPEIVEAIRFDPDEPQKDLLPVAVNGNSAYTVDPYQDDFFRRVIELRQSVKNQRDMAKKEEWDRLDTAQNSLKIAANSTAYGIYVEVVVQKRGKPVPTRVLISTGEPFDFSTDKCEQPGVYFHPLLASLITGAARLMLAIAERLVADEGLEWSFCDTDSMAIAKPETMDGGEFEALVKRIVGWFAALNPYAFGGSILKIEDENFGLRSRKPTPLYCFAVSAKRYALFNLTPDRKPIMRKVSAHGLGQYMPPYGQGDAPVIIPAPDASVLKQGIHRWHSDLWHMIVSAALSGNPDRLALDYHPALKSPAVCRYGATSPDLLRWFKSYNEGRSYRDQVKPFGFLLTMTSKPVAAADELKLANEKTRLRKSIALKPIAPFDRNNAKAIKRAFDRDSGNAVPASALKSYAEALRHYHLRHEAKFRNGDFFDRGTTQRRHIHVTGIRHIGKESNDWERQAILGYDPYAAPDYGQNACNRDEIVASLSELIEMASMTKVARALNINAAQLKRLLNGPPARNEVVILERVSGKLPMAKEALITEIAAHDSRLKNLKNAVTQNGLRMTAKKYGFDPSNLRRTLKSRN